MPRFFPRSLLVLWFVTGAVACGPRPSAVNGDEDVVDADGDSALIYDGTLSSDFPLNVGHYWPAGAEFTSLQDAQDMEIVQGIQGGVHTEIALELNLGLDHADTTIVHFDVHIQTLLDGDEVVADLQLDGFKAGNIGFGVFQTQTLPVIFEQNQAVHYEGRDAVIVVQVVFERSQTPPRLNGLELVESRLGLHEPWAPGH